MDNGSRHVILISTSRMDSPLYLCCGPGCQVMREKPNQKKSGVRIIISSVYFITDYSGNSRGDSLIVDGSVNQAELMAMSAPPLNSSKTNITELQISLPIVINLQMQRDPSGVRF